MIWNAARNWGKRARGLYRRHRRDANEAALELGLEGGLVAGGVLLFGNGGDGWDRLKAMHQHDLDSGAFTGSIEEYLALLAENSGFDSDYGFDPKVVELSRVGGIG